jgi:hypothetical protein
MVKSVWYVGKKYCFQRKLGGAPTSLARKIAAAKKEAAKASAGKNSFPPTPFLFARPSVQFGARSAPSVPLKIGSDFVKQTHK